MFYYFHNGTLDVKRLNNGVITLQPKLVGAKKNYSLSSYLSSKVHLQIDYKGLNFEIRTLLGETFQHSTKCFHQKKKYYGWSFIIA
jgi:hypothetical protein